MRIVRPVVCLAAVASLLGAGAAGAAVKKPTPKPVCNLVTDEAGPRLIEPYLIFESADGDMLLHGWQQAGAFRRTPPPRVAGRRGDGAAAAAVRRDAARDGRRADSAAGDGAAAHRAQHERHPRLPGHRLHGWGRQYVQCGRQCRRQQHGPRMCAERDHRHMFLTCRPNPR